MNNHVLQHALEYASRGWPVFPCQSGRKIPATRHGYLDAVTDPGQIYAWFGRDPGLNLAIATGAPGIDVLDVDQRGEAGDGFPALAQLEATGLLGAAIATVRTPSGGLHFYFTGSQQRSGHLPACHIDFLSQGGYVLAPPSQVNDHPYQHVTSLARHGELNWRAVTDILEPSRGHALRPPGARPPGPQPPGPDGTRAGRLARWLSAQPEGNRNNGLFWAANRALEADPAADLSPWPAPPARPGSANPRSPRPSGPPGAPPRPAPNQTAARPKEPADMTASPRPGRRRHPDAPARGAAERNAIQESIRQLREQGGTYRSIAGAAGLAPATVHDLAAGRRRPTPATTRALGKVNAASLRKARVDAGGTRLRLRALHVMGHGSARIARALGAREMTIRAITRGDAQTVSSKLRDQVAALYDAWWDKRAAERDRHERAAATAARRRAIAGNWCAGAGLDDDQLDVPGYKPTSKWKPAAGTGTAPDVHPPAKPRKNQQKRHQ